MEKNCIMASIFYMRQYCNKKQMFVTQGGDLIVTFLATLPQL